MGEAHPAPRPERLATGAQQRPWRAALKGLAALALWPAVAGTLPALGYLVGQDWLVGAWILGGGVAALGAWRLGRWRALFLCALYAAASFFLTSLLFLGQSCDYVGYHMPQVFLLEAGWNPVWQGSMAAVEAIGVAPLDTFRPFHTVCFPLLGAQWCAATDLATGALHGFNWLVALLLPGAGYLTLRTLRRCVPLGEGARRSRRAWLLTCLFLVLDYRITAAWFPLDGALYLLLLAWSMTLIAHLSGRETRLERCLAWTLPVLLAGVKQNAAVPIALGLGALLLQALVQRDWPQLRARLRLCLLSLLAIALVWCHPYLTNCLYYGGPLFPAHSFLPAYQGWDITVDLRSQVYYTAHTPLVRFLTANWVWLAQAAALGVIAWWQRRLRPLFWMALLLLLTALLMPAWLYYYARYTPATPLIGGLLLCALPALSPRLPMRRLLQGTLLFAVALSLLVDYQGRDCHYASFPKALVIAANMQSLLYFPERRPDPEDWPVIVSNTAFNYSEPSPYHLYPKRYPARNGRYFLYELYATRGGVPLRIHDAMSNLERLRHYASPSETPLLIRKDRASSRDLHPWQKACSPRAFRYLLRALPRNFRRRWLTRTPA